MVISEVSTLLIYGVSMIVLPQYFGMSCLSHLNGSLPCSTDFVCTLAQDLTFVLSFRFAWKVALIVLLSAFPLYLIKFVRRRLAPASYVKVAQY